MYVCLCVCVYVQGSKGACRGQKRALDPLELELQVTVGCLMWVLGTELCFFFFARAASALNH